MGRLQSLTAAALGRSPFEDEVIQTTGDSSARSSNQVYDDNGRPVNPETKRRQREQTRASNEVMQATGVVEESSVTKAKERASKEAEEKETLTGLRLLEFGRVSLVGGVWGVLGLRRRIMLYRPYTEMSLIEIIRLERALSPTSFMLAGLPTVMAYHVSDWAGFIFQVLVEGYYDEEDGSLSARQIAMRNTILRSIDVISCYATLHFRMFAILQQLGLISTTRLLPKVKYFIPFSIESPLEIILPSSFTISAFSSSAAVLLRSAAPMAVIFGHAKIKFWIARYVNAIIYKNLPRPSKISKEDRRGSRTFWDSEHPPSTTEPGPPTRSEDEPTLRALEGRISHSRSNSQNIDVDFELDSSDDEDGEMTHATLISFDVEATDTIENSMGSAGSWSAELRSANEPKHSTRVSYRVTALTMLPAFLAAEGLSEIVAGIILLPLEAMMVRFIGRAARTSVGLDFSDLYPVIPLVPGFSKLLSAFAIQLAVAGTIWMTTTFAAQLLASAQKENIDWDSDSE
ncbi:hypothetical protein PVAG01_00333 [Phlyctema vagabunda]|uniref:Uncharacterized protein n=1 Tax=Phlyctema vagabunda TaxID=108571 RepID=A0ABR4PTY4_9HELO